MAREFQRGHKAKISDLTAGTDLYVGVQVSGPGLSFDISCFGLDADERLSDDRYFIFFNQPKSPEESVQLLGAQAGDTESFRVTLDRIPQTIHKLSFTATIDGAGQMSQVGPGYIRIVAGGEEVVRYSFTGSEFSTERAVMLGDFYLKDVWRFAAIGQGFDGGLDALLKNFGGEVMDEEPPAEPAQPQVVPQAPVAPQAPAAQSHRRRASSPRVRPCTARPPSPRPWPRPDSSRPVPCRRRPWLRTVSRAEAPASSRLRLRTVRCRASSRRAPPLRTVRPARASHRPVSRVGPVSRASTARTVRRRARPVPPPV